MKQEAINLATIAIHALLMGEDGIKIPTTHTTAAILVETIHAISESVFKDECDAQNNTIIAIADEEGKWVVANVVEGIRPL